MGSTVDMYVQVELLIIALVMVFIGVIGGKKGKGDKPHIIPVEVATPIGLIGILIIIFMGFYHGTIVPLGQSEHVRVGNKLNIDYPVQKTQVISPLSGDAVECRILTMGVYPEDSENDVWVILKPTDNRYYPQSDFTNVSYKRNGKWQVITRFGGDEAEKYELIVYETDTNASDFFSATIQNWKDKLDYPGLELAEIPAGALEVDRIAISLKNNCRGVF